MIFLLIKAKNALTKSTKQFNLNLMKMLIYWFSWKQYPIFQNGQKDKIKDEMNQS